MPYQKPMLRKIEQGEQNGPVKSRPVKVLLIQGFMRYTRCNEFDIEIPSFSQCESDIGTDIPRIPSDILGISNYKNRYTRLVKNVEQSASICAVSNTNEL